MNQITLPAADLKQALPGLSKVVGRKSTLPVLQTVRITRNEAGLVSLSATDLDAFVSYTLEHTEAGPPIDICLPLDQLTKTVKGSKGDVVLAPESGLKLKLRYQVSGTALEQSVNTIDPKEYPPVPKVDQAGIKMPDQFGEALRQAFETSSTDSSRFVIQGAYLDVQDKNCHSIVSTNGSALFAANTFNFDLKQSVNLPRHKFLEWPGFLTGDSEMAVVKGKDNAWVKLSTPRWNCTIKQIEGNFPHWRQVVPRDTETWTKMVLSEAAVSQILSLSSKLPGDEAPDHTLKLVVGQELQLQGRDKDDKDYTSATIGEVKIIGKKVTTGINRGYLKSALRCGLNEIRINSELEPLVFLGLGKKLVVMPVRFNGPETAKKPAPTSAPTPQAPTPDQERKPDMAKTESKSEPRTQPQPNPSLISLVEQVKETLKTGIRDLNILVDAVKQVEKDQRATEKEVETARATLKKLQQVSI